MFKLPSELTALLVMAKREGKKVVLATGVFDLFHEEHEHFLQQAQTVGDMLVVGVESDVRVRIMKGIGRPVVSQADRVARVAAVPGVDYAFVLPERFFKEEDHRALLAQIQPAVLAVSSHTPHLESKHALMAEIGGSVQVVLEQNPAVSTTLRLAHV